MKLTARQVRSLRRRLGTLARQSCVNYGAAGCPFAGAGCVVAIQADSIGANTCPYFATHVLPADKALHDDYLAALPAGHPLKPAQPTQGRRSCKRCVNSYTPTGRRQLYCGECAAIVKAERDAQRKREARLENAVKTAHL